MPTLPHLSDLLVGLASSGALGIGIAVALLITLRVLLPQKDRGQLRTPLVVLGLHIVTVLVRLPLDPASSLATTLKVLSLFFLLTVLGRGAFLLIVDQILGVHLARPLSRIIHEIVLGLVYVGVALITLRAAGVETGSLLTTSALLTAVIGLSLQDTLGNLFAGLSIQAQRPFEVGDWIQFEADPRFIGQVIEINWRATKVLTTEQIEVIIPNGTLSKTAIRNFTKPTVMARRTIDVQGSYDASPRLVEQTLLGALHGVQGVLTEPPPFVIAHNFADSGVAYQLCFFINEFARRDRIDSAVRQRVWYAFRRAGITIPYATRTVHLQNHSHETQTRDEARQQARRLQSLKGVDFLAALPPPLLERLATLSKTCHYTIGEVIIHQGAAGNELFIVQSGEVAVLVGRTGGSTAEVARLGPGKFFGEMSLMTGERRSATVQATLECELATVDKEAFHEILAAAPDLAVKITEVLITRQSEIEENVSARRARSVGDADGDARSNVLLGRIRQFFAL